MTKEFGLEGSPTSLPVCRMLSIFRRYYTLHSVQGYLGVVRGFEPWTFSGGNRGVYVCVTVTLHSLLVKEKALIWPKYSISRRKGSLSGLVGKVRSLSFNAIYWSLSSIWHKQVMSINGYEYEWVFRLLAFPRFCGCVHALWSELGDVFQRKLFVFPKGNYWTWFRNLKAPVPVCNIQIYISHFIRLHIPPSQKIKRWNTTSEDLESMI
jgi:hypothetical protein